MRSVRSKKQRKFRGNYWIRSLAFRFWVTYYRSQAEESDVAGIIRDSRSGYTIGFGKKDELKSLLTQLFERFKNGSLKTEKQETAAFTRQALTAEMVQIFYRLTRRSI